MASGIDDTINRIAETMQNAHIGRRQFLKLFRDGAVATSVAVGACELGRLLGPLYEVAPPVSAHSGVSINVPIATKIPDINNPFAEGMWDEAVREPFHYNIDINLKPTSKFCYLYAMQSPDLTDLFLFTDAVPITNIKEQFLCSYTFDTRHDGMQLDSKTKDWVPQEDNIGMGVIVRPGTNPPNYEYLGGYLGGAKKDWRTEGLVMSWDHGISNNSQEEHVKLFAKVPMSILKKYPNAQDPSRMGLNAAANSAYSNYLGSFSEYTDDNGGGYADMIFLQKPAVTTSTTTPATSQTTGTSEIQMTSTSKKVNEPNSLLEIIAAGTLSSTALGALAYKIYKRQTGKKK